jgi:hypothetical protein
VRLNRDLCAQSEVRSAGRGGGPRAAAAVRGPRRRSAGRGLRGSKTVLDLRPIFIRGARNGFELQFEA